MTTPRGPEPPGRGARGGPGARGAGSGRGSPGGSRGPSPTRSPLKALAVLAVAVGLGAYLIDLGAGGHPAAGSATTTTVTTTTPPAPPPKSTTTTTTPPSGAQPSKAVKVLVANASDTDGIATYYTKKLASAGWGTLTPVTATTAFSSSSVYYGTGDARAGGAVAAALGIPSSAVQPLGSETPVSNPAGADVVVVAGDDLAAEVPASTTGSTATAGTTATATATASSG